MAKKKVKVKAVKVKASDFDDTKYDEACKTLGRQIAAMALQDEIEDDDSTIGEYLGDTLEDIRMYVDQFLGKR